jgi:hypothetical protein
VGRVPRWTGLASLPHCARRHSHSFASRTLCRVHCKLPPPTCPRRLTDESMVTETTRCSGLEIEACRLFRSFPLPRASRTTRLSPRLSRAPYVSTSTNPLVLSHARSRLEHEASTVADGCSAPGSRCSSHRPFCQSWSIAGQGTCSDC